MDKIQTFNVAVNMGDCFNKSLDERSFSATMENQNVVCRADIETKKHKASVQTTFLLEGTQYTYKGDFEKISDLNSVLAYESDYADVYETQTRWIYKDNHWQDTNIRIIINPRIITDENVAVENIPQTIPKRDENGNIYVSNPTEPLHSATKEYIDNAIKRLQDKTYIKEFTKADFKTLGLYSVYYIDIKESEHKLNKPYVKKIMAKSSGDKEDTVQFLSPIVVKEKVFVDNSIKIYIEVNLNNYSEYSGKIYLQGE